MTEYFALLHQASGQYMPAIAGPSYWRPVRNCKYNVPRLFPTEQAARISRGHWRAVIRRLQTHISQLEFKQASASLFQIAEIGVPGPANLRNDSPLFVMNDIQNQLSGYRFELNLVKTQCLEDLDLQIVSLLVYEQHTTTPCQPA